MWAYRVDKAINFFGMTRPVAKVRAVIVELHDKAVAKWTAECDRQDSWMASEQPAPADNPTLFDRDVEAAYNMARSLGWDRTIYGELQCYLVPGPDSFMYGFLLTQATSGQRFVISPVPLDYMKEHIDWNAHTSTEEVRKARHALEGGVLDRPPLSWTGGWQRSRKGNQYCFINGAQVTIFADARNGGFKAIIASQLTNLKVFTQAFPTELSCAAYVINHFYDLVKEWDAGSGVVGAGEPANDDNPFVGIDWGDDAE